MAGRMLIRLLVLCAACEGPPAVHAPAITATSTRTDGEVVYVRADFSDADGDASAFGFRGVKGAGWAEEQHDFAHPSYGHVTATFIEYPFNVGCSGDTRASSDIELWIADAGGRRSAPVVVHVECAKRTSPAIAGANRYLPMLLEKAQAPELDVISKYRATGTSQPLAFATHATYERVVVELPDKPVMYRFLIQRGSLTRLALAQGNAARVPNLIDVNIDTKDAALAYARFALEVSQGDAFQFADPPPTADEDHGTFRVTLTAVHDGKLVEYRLEIGAHGKLGVTEKTVAP